MNRLNLTLPIVLSAIITACSNNASDKPGPDIISLEQAEQQFASTLTASDTTEVLGLGQKVMDHMIAGETDSVFAIVVDPATCAPLDSMRAARLSKHYQGGFLSAELEYFAFSLNGINDLKYRLTSADGSTISIMFNPVKTEDGWALGLKTERTPSKDQDKPLHPMTPIFVNS